MGIPKSYDPREIIISWIPVPTPGVELGAVLLNKGIADGTFVTVAREVPVNVKRIGGDGEGTRIKSNNRSGLITVTLRNGSDTNDTLSTILGVYEASNQGNIGVLTMKDSLGNSLYTSPSAYLEGWPDKSYSEGSEDDLVWTLVCHELVMYHGGNNSA